MSVKPAIKTLWLLILAALLIGLGLTGLGVALGGSMPTGFGPGTRGMRFYDWRAGTYYDSRMRPVYQVQDGTSAYPHVKTVREDVHSLSVSLVSTGVMLIPTSDSELSYSIRTEDLSQYRIEVTDGTLEIEFEANPTFFGLGNILTVSDSDQIIINIPRDMVLQKVEVRNVSGFTNIAGNRQYGQPDHGEILQADHLELTTVSGDIWIDENVQASRLDLTTVSGEINAGGIGLDTPQGTALNLEIVSGSAFITAANLSSLNVDMVSGHARLAIHDLDDFDIEVSNISGTVSKDGQVISSGIGSGRAGHGRGGKSIEVSVISGDISLDLAPQEDGR